MSGRGQSRPAYDSLPIFTETSPHTPSAPWRPGRRRLPRSWAQKAPFLPAAPRTDRSTDRGWPGRKGFSSFLSLIQSCGREEQVVSSPLCSGRPTARGYQVRRAPGVAGRARQVSPWGSRLLPSDPWEPPAQSSSPGAPAGGSLRSVRGWPEPGPRPLDPGSPFSSAARRGHQEGPCPAQAPPGAGQVLGARVSPRCRRQAGSPQLPCGPLLRRSASTTVRGSGHWPWCLEKARAPGVTLCHRTLAGLSVQHTPVHKQETRSSKAGPPLVGGGPRLLPPPVPGVYGQRITRCQRPPAFSISWHP